MKKINYIASKKLAIYARRKFSPNDNDKKYHKVTDHCHYTGKYRATAHNVCNLRYKTAKDIPILFHNGAKYDYHFIIKELAEKFKGQFESLGENTEKYITFSVPIKKELENNKIISYKIRFIDSFRFMPNSLSSPADNLAEGLRNDKCPDCKFCLEYISIKGNQLIFKSLKCILIKV